jgi:hypothetical protein
MFTDGVMYLMGKADAGNPATHRNETPVPESNEMVGKKYI